MTAPIAQGSVDVDVRALIDTLAKLARRDHYYCEDPWYSCPKAEDGCANENAGDECNCGADKHNAKVEGVKSQIDAVLCPNVQGQRGDASPACGDSAATEG